MSYNVVSKVLEVSEGDVKNFSLPQRAIAFMICKNLRDMTETGLAIIQGLPEDKKKNLPGEFLLGACMRYLDGSYPNNLFNEDGEFVYTAKAVDEFGGEAVLALSIYLGLKRQLTKETLDHIRARDEEYFVKNFDKLTADLGPLRQYVEKFRGFIGNKDIGDESKEVMWEFFDCLCDIILNEEEYIKDYMS